MIKKSVSLLGLLGGAFVSLGASPALISKNQTISLATENIYSSYSVYNAPTSLGEVIQNRDLGVVLIHSNSATVSEKESAIISSLWLKNQSLDITHVKLSFGSENRAFVSATPNGKYEGKTTVTFKFKVGRLLPLKVIAKNSELGEIKSQSKIPSDAQIKESFKSKNLNVNLDGIKIINKTHVSSLIAGDGEIYTGIIAVNFYVLDTVNSLSAVLKETNLGQIFFDEKINPEQLLSKIKERNPEINIDWIYLNFVGRNDAVQVFGDETNYSGDVWVNFEAIIQLDIQKDLSIVDLGEIEIQESEVEANMFEDVIINHIYNLYETNNIKREIIDRIVTIAEVKDSNMLNKESTSVTIKGKPVANIAFNSRKIKTIYINEATLTFTFKVVPNQ